MVYLFTSVLEINLIVTNGFLSLASMGMGIIGAFSFFFFFLNKCQIKGYKRSNRWTNKRTAEQRHKKKKKKRREVKKISKTHTYLVLVCTHIVSSLPHADLQNKVCFCVLSDKRRRTRTRWTWTRWKWKWRRRMKTGIDEKMLFFFLVLFCVCRRRCCSHYGMACRSIVDTVWVRPFYITYILNWYTTRHTHTLTHSHTERWRPTSDYVQFYFDLTWMSWQWELQFDCEPVVFTTNQSEHARGARKARARDSPIQYIQIALKLSLSLSHTHTIRAINNIIYTNDSYSFGLWFNGSKNRTKREKCVYAVQAAGCSVWHIRRTQLAHVSVCSCTIEELDDVA